MANDLAAAAQKVRYRPVGGELDRLLLQLSDREWMMVDGQALVVPLEDVSANSVPLNVGRIRWDVLTLDYQPSSRTVQTRILTSAEQ